MDAYHFSQSGSSADTVAAFLELCRAEPLEAATHLQAGYFEPWLRDAGRPDLAQYAIQSRLAVADPAACLADFLTTATRALAFAPDAWPAAALALEFVRPSYDIVTRRYELIENRARALMTLAATMIIAAPAVSAAVLGRATPSILSPWFGVAVVAFVVLLILVVFMMTRTLEYVHPKKLHDEYLDYAETEFQVAMIAFAGRHYTTNSATLFNMIRTANAVAALVLLEAIALACWILTNFNGTRYF